MLASDSKSIALSTELKTNYAICLVPFRPYKERTSTCFVSCDSLSALIKFSKFFL